MGPDERDGPAGTDLFGRPFGTWAEIQAEAAVDVAWWLTRAGEIHRLLAGGGVVDAERPGLEKEQASLLAIIGAATIGRPFCSYLELDAMAAGDRAEAIMDRLDRAGVPDDERAALKAELLDCRSAMQRWFPGA